MWAWCHVTPSLQTCIHRLLPPSPWAGPQGEAVFQPVVLRKSSQNWTPGSHTVGCFSVDKDLSQETASGQPVALTLILFHFPPPVQTWSSCGPLSPVKTLCSLFFQLLVMMWALKRPHAWPRWKKYTGFLDRSRFSVCAAQVSTAAPVCMGSLAGGSEWNFRAVSLMILHGCVI